MFSLSLSFGLAGFAAGAYLGLRNRTADPNLPIALGAILGAACYMVAQTLLILLGVVLVVALTVAAIRYRSVVEQVLLTFAQFAGRYLVTRSFTRRGVQISNEFAERQAFLNTLPIDSKERDSLREKDRRRFSDAIDWLGRQYAYVPDDMRFSSKHTAQTLEDLYDME